MANSNSNTARAAALARRRAQSQSGKATLSGQAAVNTAPTPQPSPARAATTTVARSVATANTSRAASMARRHAMSAGGKAAIKSKDRARSAESVQSPSSAQPAPAKSGDCGCGCKGQQADAVTTPVADTRSNKPVATKYQQKPRRATVQSPARAASLARRQATSSRGKSGLGANGVSAAQSARAMNPQLSGRELAQTLREQRSKMGKSGQKKSESTRRTRPARATNEVGAAQDAPWKVGVSETSQGQSVTGTMVGRSVAVTGDEPSTCRAVTGTEYLGADIFREFCQSEPNQPPTKVSITSTAQGNLVSGNEVGRSKSVTGDEAGTCKRVTGNQYVSSEQADAFCGLKPEAAPAKITSAGTRKGKSVTGNNVGRSSNVTGDELGAARELTGSQYMTSGDNVGKAPAKVGMSATLRGGMVSGTMVGRNDNVTGDEPGSCRNITGDDYVGQEQYSSFCEAAPAPADAKVGFSKTIKGEYITGTIDGRSGNVTGNEPGTCKAITGTPYAGGEQYEGYCQSADTAQAVSRAPQRRGAAGAVMTGQQPGVGGVMTGANKGACEPLTGTPYVGADQFANACPSTPADVGSPDFPQPLSGNAPWGQFSVAAPSHAAQAATDDHTVTGVRYEQGGHITGPFDMAGGKVTGTEEFRFGREAPRSSAQAPVPATAEMIDGRVKSRVTGEGMEAGIRVTGDDWDRGDSVTGTEGTSARRRNPTRRGGMDAMAMQQPQSKRNEEVPEPISKVTGGSGNTEKGSLITYSGGARG